MKKGIIITSSLVGVSLGFYFLNNYLKDAKEKRRIAKLSPNEYYQEPVQYLTYCGCGKSH